MRRFLTAMMALAFVAAPVYTTARDKAPFSICIIRSKIPDKDEKDRVKNLNKHLKNRFEAVSDGSDPEECPSDLYLLREVEGKDPNTGVFGGGFGQSRVATVGLRVVGFSPDQELTDEPAVNQMFAGKQGFMSRGSWTSKGGAEKDAVKKIHEWADDNRDAIAEALQKTLSE